MVPQIRLSQAQASDLSRVCDLPPNALAQVVEQISRLPASTLRPNALVAATTSALHGQSDHAERLIRHALSFNSLMRAIGLTETEMASGISAAIERDTDWDEETLLRWRALQPYFLQLIVAGPVRRVSNALNLSYEFANLFRRGRIITDVRPLFDESAQHIEGAVISFVLRLRYDNSEGDHDISIAMDEEDVKQLLDQCQRAQRKAYTARTLLNDRAEVPTFVAGEPDNA
jgi:hypothetical protein